ncbi:MULTISPECIES: thioredoxin domain-containing protein [Trichocoleus]|uniref:Thioredoxin domain-containing protein n=1 Tax=Trichocoleus desertorum GB2-A4 TaxID=2933944 RepID=A0ABV0JGZ1_9CYAN|nr:thioredoxin domain-containing protein [Trichocoleus sp. FACHB-46]MBD1864829.1 DsbA family protein [Trichocoleus sp. FACHB-46]
MNQDSYPNQLFVSPSQRDHYQGMLNAPIILVEYGNYQCPQCREVRQLIQAIQQHFNSGFSEENWVCVVFRHFVQNSIYPQAQKAAQAAGAQGQFWQMRNMLFIHSQELGHAYLVEYADVLRLNISKFLQNLSNQVHVDRINQDMKSGLNSGVTSLAALFINEIRYRDRWNMEQLMAAITAENH